jgi:hypothetical protein
MTGFYVANVVSRYWEQFISLPMPDKLAYKLVAYIPGQVSPFSFIELNIMKHFHHWNIPYRTLDFQLQRLSNLGDKVNKC